MKNLLMKRFGPLIGIALCFAAVLSFAFLPASCQLTPEQAQRLQSISVPAASLGLTLAQSQGWIEPGDKITITRGVAVVTSRGDTQTKLFQLAELGMETALRRGLVNEGDVISLVTPSHASISAPPPPAPLPTGTPAARLPDTVLLPAK
jgi:hypothetical protein